MSKDSDFLQRLKSFVRQENLPEKSVLLEEAVTVSEILSTEKTSYRPLVPDLDITGGLLDFSRMKAKPVIVVPDLHARTDFLFNLIDFKLNGKTVFQQLLHKEIYVVLVGDIMHSESRAKSRWLKALEEYENGNPCGKNMKKEMAESLNTYLSVMTLKRRFPENFHCLKGNHENIRNSCENGNYSFRKFVYEGEMVSVFMNEYYGPEVICAIDGLENLLPVASVFPQCIVSHAEPKTCYSKNELIESPLNPDVIFNLTWTNNGEAEKGCVEKMLSSLTKEKKLGFPATYFGGHRPVTGRYSLRQNGRFVQIHNPGKQNVAFVPCERCFDPETDIYSVNEIQ